MKHTELQDVSTQITMATLELTDIFATFMCWNFNTSEDYFPQAEGNFIEMIKLLESA